MYLLITHVKPMVTHLSDFAFCYVKALRSDNQSQKNKDRSKILRWAGLKGKCGLFFNS